MQEAAKREKSANWEEWALKAEQRNQSDSTSEKAKLKKSSKAEKTRQKAEAAEKWKEQAASMMAPTRQKDFQLSKISSWNGYSQNPEVCVFCRRECVSTECTVLGLFPSLFPFV